MELKKVEFQSWNTLVSTVFYICQNCSHVDMDRSRMVIGTPCKYCRAPSPSARFHFGISSMALVDSIQDFYFLRRASVPADRHGMASHVHTNKTDTRIVIPLLFCTLHEGLTTQLCQNIMRAKALEKSLQERLLSDYLYAKEKREKLFPALTGEKWNGSLAAITEAAQLDYTKHFNFFLTINKGRNTFIHEGSHWHFKDEDLEQIPEELWTAFSLFVQLHNRYVVKPI